MANSIHGGAADVIDIGAKNTTGSTVSVGDVLMLDFDTERDGYSAIKPVLVNQKDYTVPVGVVLGQTGSTYPDDSNILLRVKGICKANVESTQDIAVEDHLVITTTKDYFTTTAAQQSLGATVATVAAADASATAVAPAALTSPATFNTMTYTSTESDALRDDVEAVRAEVVKLVTDVSVLITLANECKADINTNNAIIEDLLETQKVRAVALEARTDNSEGLISVFMIGKFA